MPQKKLIEAIFPPLSEAKADGLLALGGKLTAPYLLTAYTQGIFPWPLDCAPSTRHPAC
jgi:Leu/Phe-tRNA-protein transferase